MLFQSVESGDVMEDPDRIQTIVLKAIKEIDPQILRGKSDHDINSIPIAGSMDSISMVTLIVDLEEELKKELGKEITLIGHPNQPSQVEPFRNIGTIIDYVKTVIAEKS